MSDSDSDYDEGGDQLKGKQGQTKTLREEHNVATLAGQAHANVANATNTTNAAMQQLRDTLAHDGTLPGFTSTMGKQTQPAQAYTMKRKNGFASSFANKSLNPTARMLSKEEMLNDNGFVVSTRVQPVRPRSAAVTMPSAEDTQLACATSSSSRAGVQGSTKRTSALTTSALIKPKKTQLDPTVTYPEYDVVRQSEFLRSKFQVGSSRSDKMNFGMAEQVFHASDMPLNVKEMKKETVASKRSRTLPDTKATWNQSTIADDLLVRCSKAQEGAHGARAAKSAATASLSGSDLRQQLLEVRAGLRCQPRTKPDAHLQPMRNTAIHAQDESKETQDMIRHIVAITNKGPIGQNTAKWFNPLQERHLSSYAVAEPDWNRWDPSFETSSKESKKAAAARFDDLERRRIRMNDPNVHIDQDLYLNPSQITAKINQQLRQRKIDFQDLKEHFKLELRQQLPTASEERLQALAQRLLYEKMLADEKLKRFPVQHESFKPNLSLTTAGAFHSVRFQNCMVGFVGNPSTPPQTKPPKPKLCQFARPPLQRALPPRHLGVQSDRAQILLELLFEFQATFQRMRVQSGEP